MNLESTPESVEQIGKISREELLGSTDLLRSVFDSVPNGIIIIDHNQTIRMTNAAFKTAVGPDSGAVIGRQSNEVFQSIGGSPVHHRCDGEASCLACQVQAVAADALIRGQAQSRPVQHIIEAGGVSHGVEAKLHAAPITSRGEVFAIVQIEDLDRIVSLRRWMVEGGMGEMVGVDRSMLELFWTIKRVAPVDVTVLIEGESGSGKEMVASALHRLSRRSAHRIVPVNCGALSPGLLESELFGHVKGAFTGAVREKKGRFELAHRGTLFLDEVGELNPGMQVKLLRVIQDGLFERVGGEKTISADVRLVCATNRSLSAAVAAKKFRTDLYYRLSVVHITVPPLRERKGDIPLLAEHLLAKAAREYGFDTPELTADVSMILRNYHWPGNVRQLENSLRHAMVKSAGEAIHSQHLPSSVMAIASPQTSTSKKDHKGKLTAERVEWALRECDGNKVRAARSLGVSRATLYRFLGAQSRD